MLLRTQDPNKKTTSHTGGAQRVHEWGVQRGHMKGAHKRVWYFGQDVPCHIALHHVTSHPSHSQFHCALVLVGTFVQLFFSVLCEAAASFAVF